MKKLTCIACMADSSQEYRIAQCLQVFDSVRIIDIARNKVSLIEKVNQYRPDILFINLDAQELNFEESVRIIHRPPFIIGVTSREKNLRHLLELGVFDFIEPKIKVEEFCRTIFKILYICNSLWTPEPLIAKEDENPYQSNFYNTKDHTFIRYKKANTKIIFNDILYIKNIGNCLRIECTNNKIYYHRCTLKQFLSILPTDKFIRINKSIIINYKRIDKVEKTIVYIKKQAFKVTRSYIAKFRELIKQFG